MNEFLVETNTLNNRIQKVYKFDNGYGASVIKGPNTYGGAEGLWEVAVIDNFSPNFPDNLAEDESPWEICYTSGLTDDVFGRLNDPEVDAVLRQINNL